MSEATIFTKLQLQLWAPHAAAWLAHVGTVRQNIANYVYTVAFKNALHTMCLRFIQHFACLESKNCEHTPDIPLNFSYKIHYGLYMFLQTIPTWTKTVEPKVAFLYLKLEHSPKSVPSTRLILTHFFSPLETSPMLR